jgi:hypothetical protein
MYDDGGGEMTEVNPAALEKLLSDFYKTNF